MSSILGFAAQKFGGFWSIFSNSGSIRAALPHPGVSTNNSIHLCQKRGCSDGIKTPFPTGMARGRSSRQELTQVLPFLPLPARSEPFFGARIQSSPQNLPLGRRSALGSLRRMDFPKKDGNEPISLRCRSCRSGEEEEQTLWDEGCGVFLGNGDAGSGSRTRPTALWAREKLELVKMG